MPWSGVAILPTEESGISHTKDKHTGHQMKPKQRLLTAKLMTLSADIMQEDVYH